MCLPPGAIVELRQKCACQWRRGSESSLCDLPLTNSPPRTHRSTIKALHKRPKDRVGDHPPSVRCLRLGTKGGLTVWRRLLHRTKFYQPKPSTQARVDCALLSGHEGARAVRPHFIHLPPPNQGVVARLALACCRETVSAKAPARHANDLSPRSAAGGRGPRPVQSSRGSPGWRCWFPTFQDSHASRGQLRSTKHDSPISQASHAAALSRALPC